VSADPAVDRHVAFLGALRGAGLAVSLAEGIDAARAVVEIGVGDRETMRTAYAATVVKRQTHRPAFDALFDLWFPQVIGDGTPSAEPVDDTAEPEPIEITGGYGDSPEVQELRERLGRQLLAGDDAGLARLARAAVTRFGQVPTGNGGGWWSPGAVMDTLNPRTLVAGLLRTVRPADDLAEQVTRRAIATRIRTFEGMVQAEARRRVAEERGVERTAAYAVRPPVEQLDFLAATAADIAAMRREIYPLSRRLATRISMNRRRGRRGPLDFRRTIRRSLATGGVPVDTVHRPRPPRKPELVVICDVSSSVAAFARFALLLVHALREQFTRVRAFVFVDRPIEVTRHLTDGTDVYDALTRMQTDGVRLLAGGTNYGRVFTDIAEQHADAIGPKTALLVLGDARANYLALRLDVLAGLVDSARHAYWLNPEPRSRWGTGDSAAPAYAEVMPMFDCRNLVQLGEFVEHLA
jgi:uncharacterized protein with von Willebrand factor type A (vWA) domain